MARPVTLFTGQWADLPFETICQKAKAFGYDGLELACWGDHFDVRKAVSDPGYVKTRWDILGKYGLKCYAISSHLVGQAICDLIDPRHKQILPDHIWGDGEPEGVRQRAAEEMKLTAKAARLLFDAAPAAIKNEMKHAVVNGFTGSSIWHLVYSFPPVLPNQLEQGYQDFADRWNPILDEFDKYNVVFALEVHPTEIAFDVVSAKRALEAVGNRKAFGFNYDPSHFVYQGVDYVQFIRELGSHIYHVHMKDAWFSPTPRRSGVFGGHLPFGDRERYWEFRSLGHGSVNFEEIIRNLNFIGYQGPLSVEWEDQNMNREHGATEAAAFVKRVNFAPSDIVFDAQFDR
ncbi:MAG: sugar phosphate isomerase/epimerase [Phycisphaerae bacterium]